MFQIKPRYGLLLAANIALLSGMLASCAYAGVKSRETASVRKIVSDRESLFEKDVYIHGFLVADFENINVYGSRSDFERNNRNCITLGVTDELKAKAAAKNHKYVRIDGQLHRDYIKSDELCLSCCTTYAILPTSIR
jgi:hypothetical protein